MLGNRTITAGIFRESCASSVGGLMFSTGPAKTTECITAKIFASAMAAHLMC